MSGPPPLPINEQERADLVAFLDGELSGEAARAIEAKISLDPRMRAEAESLKKAWELLDYLPKPEPTTEFTGKTMSRLKALRPGEDGALRRWLIAAGAWAAGLLLAAGGGYAGFRAMTVPEPGERELTRDLRLIENKRYYDRVDDFDFVEKLDHPDLFGDETQP